MKSPGSISRLGAVSSASSVVKKMRHYYHLAGIRGLVAAIRGKLTKTEMQIKVFRPELTKPFQVRIPSSDLDVVEQIFINQEYRFDVRFQPKTIIDAGANTGLASIYFAHRFPGARIFAIEPEESNFKLLTENTVPYANIVPIHAALWHENRKINLVDPKLGKWGFMTEAGDSPGAHSSQLVGSVDAITLGYILEKYAIQRIDILKVDIEGAELEVFSNSSSWIDKVDGVIVELHERLKAGCTSSFYNGTIDFDDEWISGENVYRAKRSGCLVRPES